MHSVLNVFVCVCARTNVFVLVGLYFMVKESLIEALIDILSDGTHSLNL